MKKLIFSLCFIFICSSAFATNWCENASTELCLTAEEGVTTADDRSSNNFTITKVQQATQSSTQAAFGTYSYIFDGNGDALTLSDPTGIIDFEGADEDFSVCAWVRPDVLGTKNIVEMGDGNDDFWRFLMIDNPDTGNFWGSLNAKDVKSGAAATATTWVHVCMVMDRDGNGQVWVNGSTSGSAVALFSETLNITSTTLYMGIFHDGSQDFDGYIDELMIYSDLLTEANITDIYTNGLISTSSRRTMIIQ